MSGGRLVDVVAEIAAQARATVQIEAQAGNERVSGVEGVYTLSAALGQVLRGTEWRLEVDKARAFRIVRVATGDEIVVTARRTDFVETSSSMLTRTDTPLRETPATVDTVTREVFETQNAISLAEAYRNLPGVIFTPNGITSQAIIGQSDNGGATYTNGLRNSDQVQNGPLTDVEAVEALKGPASILVGNALAGGVINFVPKRATGRRAYDVTLGNGADTADREGQLPAAAQFHAQ